VILGLIFRKPLYELLPLLRKVKYRDFEAEFGNDVKDVESQVEKVIPAPTEPVTSPTTRPEAILNQPQPEDNLTEVASVSPRAAIFQAWQVVEVALHQALDRRRLLVAPNAPGPRMALALEKVGALQAPQVEVLRRLWDLRNRAVHDPAIVVDYDTAADYIRSATRMAEYVRQL